MLIVASLKLWDGEDLVGVLGIQRVNGEGLAVTDYSYHIHEDANPAWRLQKPTPITHSEEAIANHNLYIISSRIPHCSVSP